MSFGAITQAAALFLLGFQLSFINAKPVQLERRCLYTGSIRLKHYANNADLGWMGNVQPNRLYWTTNSPQKLPLSFTYQDPNTVFAIKIGDTSPGYPFVGVAGESTLTTVPSSPAPYFTRSNAVPFGLPQSVGNADTTGKSQTFVWKFNPATKELSGVWTNPDGTVIPTFFYTSPVWATYPEIRMAGDDGSGTILRKLRLYFEEV
ncbi:hypothetical protein BKA70DRAFT_1255526 [Coprinopsis sp. MPI-PUGE-AT-0042]|nr:hypothetical protein BKA70DRAFT_1255526 [Coprinopsis sp. MPI-PUGE-AT-0042]